jgi:hypothetical protein
MDGDMPLVIDLRVKMEVKHIQGTHNRGSSSVQCLRGFSPGVFEGRIFKLGVLGIKQLCQISVLAWASNAPIYLAGRVGEIKA